MLRVIAESIARDLGEKRKHVLLPELNLNIIGVDWFQRFLSNMISIKERPKGYNPRVRVGKNKKWRCVILVSGGLDSTIAYLVFRRTYQAHELLPLYVGLGKIHGYQSKELRALNRMNIPYVFDMFEFPPSSKPWDHIIPGRNFLLLSVAIDYVCDKGIVVLSSVSGETPETGGDKSLQFYRDVEELSFKLLGKSVKIVTLSNKTKSEWIRYVISLYGYDRKQEIVDLLKKTVSCFSSVSGHCGRCRACLRKFIAMETAGINTNGIFDENPILGCKEIVREYENKMRRALVVGDFSYYSKKRCLETLFVIEKYRDRKYGS